MKNRPQVLLYGLILILLAGLAMTGLPVIEQAAKAQEYRLQAKSFREDNARLRSHIWALGAQVSNLAARATKGESLWSECSQDLNARTIALNIALENATPCPSNCGHLDCHEMRRMAEVALACFDYMEKVKDNLGQPGACEVLKAKEIK